MVLYLLLAAAIVLVDQLVKWWAVQALGPGGSIPVIPGVFHLTYAENRGAAFSILEGRRLFFVAATVVMVVLLAILVKQGLIRGRFGRLAALFIVAGALGNLIDRIFRGYVVDLFDLRIIHFAIFNVADVFITLGGLMLVIYFAFLEGRVPGGKTDGEQTTDRRA